MMRMRYTALFTGVLVLGTAVNVGLANESELPPEAEAGECYAKIVVPAQFEVTKQNVEVSPESTQSRVIPAKYENAIERIVVEEASEKLVPVPAKYKTVRERVLITPASTKLVTVPAKFKTVKERIVEEPARTVWKKGRGPLEKVNHATGEIMCKVEIPAKTRIVSKRVLVTPENVKEKEIPAQYKTVKKRVVAEPATFRKVPVPAKYAKVNVRKLVSPEKTVTKTIPAKFKTRTVKTQVAAAQAEWKPVLCQTNMSAQTIENLQRALKKAGFNPGDVDGSYGRSTQVALEKFQKAKGLARGHLSIESLKALNVNI